MVSRFFSGGGASLGRAVLELRTDNSGLNSGLDDAEQRTQRFGRIGAAAVAAVGVAAVAAVGQSIRAYANMGDEVQKMAQRTGLGTEAVSELRYAADLSGTSIDELEGALRRMQRTVVDAGAGTSSAVESLDGLGIEVGELLGLDPEAQFLRIAGALAAVEDETTRAALAQEVFGRSGTALLPMLADGTAGLEAMRREARDLGIVFDQEAADKAAHFNDTLSKLDAALMSIQFTIASAALPMVENIAEATTDWVETHGDEFAENLAAGIGEAAEIAGTLLTTLQDIASLGAIQVVFDVPERALLAGAAAAAVSGHWALAVTLAGAAGASAGAAQRESGQAQDWWETFQNTGRGIAGIFGAEGLWDRTSGGFGLGIGGQTPQQRAAAAAGHLAAEGGYAIWFPDRPQIPRGAGMTGDEIALLGGVGTMLSTPPAGGGAAGRGGTGGGLGAVLAQAERDVAEQIRVAAERREAVDRRALQVRENELQRWAEALVKSRGAIEAETNARQRAAASLLGTDFPWNPADFQRTFGELQDYIGAHGAASASDPNWHPNDAYDYGEEP